MSARPEGIFINPFERDEIGPDLFRAACRRWFSPAGLFWRNDLPSKAGHHVSNLRRISNDR